MSIHDPTSNLLDALAVPPFGSPPPLARPLRPRVDKSEDKSPKSLSTSWIEASLFLKAALAQLMACSWPHHWCLSGFLSVTFLPQELWHAMATLPTSHNNPRKSVTSGPSVTLEVSICHAVRHSDRSSCKFGNTSQSLPNPPNRDYF